MSDKEASDGKELLFGVAFLIIMFLSGFLRGLIMNATALIVITIISILIMAIADKTASR